MTTEVHGKGSSARAGGESLLAGTRAQQWGSSPPPLQQEEGGGEACRSVVLKLEFE